MNAKVFGREPAAIVGAIQGVLALLVSFGLLDFIGIDGEDDLALVVAVLGAGASLYLAYVTSETLLAPVIEVAKASLALGAIYGLSLDAEQTGLLIAALTTVVSAYHRDRVSPLDKPSFSVIAPDDTSTGYAPANPAPVAPDQGLTYVDADEPDIALFDLAPEVYQQHGGTGSST